MKDDRLYLIHIAECIKRIESYTHEGREAFLASSMTKDAVIRNFEVIGEAVKQISPGFRETHAELAWRKMAAFRGPEPALPALVWPAHSCLLQD